MNKLLWYDGERQANGIYTDDFEAASVIAEALKKDGWKVVWTRHATDYVEPMRGYEAALKEWQEVRDK